MLKRSPTRAAPRSSAAGSMLSRGASLVPIKLRIAVRPLPLMRRGMRAIADTLPVSGGVNVACSYIFDLVRVPQESQLQAVRSGAIPYLIGVHAVGILIVILHGGITPAR